MLIEVWQHLSSQSFCPSSGNQNMFRHRALDACSVKRRLLPSLCVLRARGTASRSLRERRYPGHGLRITPRETTWAKPRHNLRITPRATPGGAPPDRSDIQPPLAPRPDHTARGTPPPSDPARSSSATCRTMALQRPRLYTWQQRLRLTRHLQ